MIQRKQTIYFLAIVVSCLMMLFGDVSFYEVSNAAEGVKESVAVEYDSIETLENNEVASSKNPGLFYLIVCVGVVGLFSLLMFRNRKLQAKLAALNFLFILAIIVMMYLGSLNIEYFKESKGGYTWFALMPVGLMLLNYLGLKGVRNDEKLVRSMDRLR